MPNFAYVAIGRDGKKHRGLEVSDNRKMLEAKLKRQHFMLVECKEATPRAVSLAVTIGLITQLNNLIGSGIVVDRALQIIEEDSEDKKLSQLASNVRAGIKRGQALHAAVAAAGRFDLLLIPSLKAGEATGELPRILSILQEHYDRKLALRREIIGHMAYPLILVFANILSLTALGLYVIPVFKGLFEDRMQVLPASTRAIFTLSDLLVANGSIIALVLTGVIVGLVALWRGSAALRAGMDRLALATPVLGPQIGKLQALNVMAILGVLLQGAVPLLKALDLTVQVVGNSAVRSGMEWVVNDVRRGGRFAAALATVPAMPKVALRFVVVGEETGNLGGMCAQAASELRKDTQARLKTMVTVLEPVLIALMGGVVAFVVVSMLVAVYSISDVK
jgi:general secretion pathway protein F